MVRLVEDRVRGGPLVARRVRAARVGVVRAVGAYVSAIARLPFVLVQSPDCASTLSDRRDGRRRDCGQRRGRASARAACRPGPACRRCAASPPSWASPGHRRHGVQEPAPTRPGRDRRPQRHPGPPPPAGRAPGAAAAGPGRAPSTSPAGSPTPRLLPRLDAAPAPASPAQLGRAGRVRAVRAVARAGRARRGNGWRPTACRSRRRSRSPSGTLDAIERLLSAYLRPGDRVAVEDPGLGQPARPGRRARPARRCRCRSTTRAPPWPGCAGPSPPGSAAVVVTSPGPEPDRRRRLRRPGRRALRPILAGPPDLLVIEDDHAAELAQVPLAPLAGAGPTWAFIRSVSKPYGPDLRVAVVAGDEASIARVEGRMRLGAGWVSTVLQRLVVELWRDPAVAAAGRRGPGRVRPAPRRPCSPRWTGAGWPRTAGPASTSGCRRRTSRSRWRPCASGAGRSRPGSLYRIASPRRAADHGQLAGPVRCGPTRRRRRGRGARRAGRVRPVPLRPRCRPSGCGAAVAPR